jgi:hypothetical protein
MIKKISTCSCGIPLALACITAILLILPSPARAGDDGKAKNRIAVMNFSANNTGEGTSRAVRNNVELNLFKDGSFDILEQNQVDVILKERRLQMMECRDEKCAARLGQILKANYVIIGSVDKLDTFTINLKVVDVKEGKIIISESKDAREMGDLRGASEELAVKVAGRIKSMGKGRVVLPFPLYISANFQYTFPIGYLKRVTKAGYGSSLTFRMEDLFVKNLMAGVEAQFIYLEGARELHHAMMIPIMAQFGYAFHVWRLSFIPIVSAGASYNMNYFYADVLQLRTTLRSGFQFVFKAGGAIECIVYKNFHVRIGAEYGSFFEKGGDVPFISTIAGIGIKF